MRNDDAVMDPKRAERGIKTRNDKRFDALLSSVTIRLSNNKRVRRSLGESGRLHVDRLLPFLLLYRRPTDRLDPGTASLVTSEAAYLTTVATAESDRAVRQVVLALAKMSYEHFGSFLLLEVWSRPSVLDPSHPLSARTARHTVHFRESAPIDADLAQILVNRMGQLSSANSPSAGSLVPAQRVHPPSTGAALSSKTLRELQCSHIGLEIEATYQSPDGKEFYPLVLRALRTRLGRELRRMAYRFAENHTSLRPTNYRVLGRRSVVKAVWEVDTQLGQVASAFDFLFAVNPVSVKELWSAFRRSRFEKVPRFLYQPLPFDPSTEKRKLFSVPLERIEDPTLAEIFIQKQMELDRRITMLIDRGSPRFLNGSMAMYGSISDELRRTAEMILEQARPRSRGAGLGARLDTEQVLERAREEVAYYHGLSPEFNADVRLSPDILSGLMVSRGNLFVQTGTTLPKQRVEALLQHEIGTHLVTYYNGDAQRFSLLRSGLADYEELQEGLAVLAEYLAGGLTVDRMRTLAARVLGAQMLMSGATFIDAFRLICRFGFASRAAFNICIRLFRGGGFTKDLIYLRGLVDLSKYLAAGGSIEPILVGKIALRHVQFIRELMDRKLVIPPLLIPRFLETDAGKLRLAKLQQGQSVLDLVRRDPQT